MCDGSFDNGYGVSAWCTDGNGSIIRGSNTVPLGSDTLDPIRCELAGIYIILQIVDYMVKYCDLNNGVIEISCDCKGGLIRTLLRGKSDFHFVSGSHLDLINSINIITRNDKTKIIGSHVSSHQDDYCFYGQLDWRGQRNVDMDLLSKLLMYDRHQR